MKDSFSELAISLNIRLPENIYEYISSLQKRSLEITSDLRNYNTAPHLAIATKFIPQHLIEKYIKILHTELINTTRFEITFSNLSLTGDKKYIFIEPDMQSKNNINELRKYALEVTQGIGYETQGNLPSKHEYVPHISIIKCNPEITESVYKNLMQGLMSISGSVSELYITRETRLTNKATEFPEVLTIRLK